MDSMNSKLFAWLLDFCVKDFLQYRLWEPLTQKWLQCTDIIYFFGFLFCEGILYGIQVCPQMSNHGEETLK